MLKYHDELVLFKHNPFNQKARKADFYGYATVIYLANYCVMEIEIIFLTIIF
ncbi:hypothetical protein [Enterococcus sp. AZ072]|uniref:hypothetical protein n=1 Tax=Enterococcus sp. AZ072 TaxID=2774640 RepID=UPI003D2D4B0E